MPIGFSLFLLILLIPCTAPHPSRPSIRDQSAAASELWCVAKNNADDASLQSALDWACGAGGADCSPIQPGGSCYDSTDVQNMASFAFNDYFRKHGMTDDSCFFQNSAAITSLNPSTFLLHSDLSSPYSKSEILFRSDFDLSCFSGFGNCRFPSSVLRNGNFSSQTTSVGIEPSEDLSGSPRTSGRAWVWPVVIGYLFLRSM
ncbi:hypothetical protein Csa_004137 [Cucumis sativus]|nr:hypothetical protein Csa_004137 [Cucumis sativus]